MTKATEPLFSAETTSIDHLPSEALQSRAEIMQHAYDRLPRFGGYLMRIAGRRETKVVKVALAIPAVVEILAELPVSLAPAMISAGIADRRFRKSLIAEYPHLHGRDEPTIFMPPHRLKGGTSSSYAEAVLAYERPDDRANPPSIIAANAG